MAVDPLALATGSRAAVPLRFAAGVAGGVAATLVMDLAMGALEEGETPPAVASGVLTDRAPGDAPERLASVVHYLAGGLTGPLFVWLLYASEALLGATLVAALAATAVLYALMVGFFVLVVLPRSRVAKPRLGPIRRDWALSAAAYLLVLVPVVVLASRAI